MKRSLGLTVNSGRNLINNTNLSPTSILKDFFFFLLIVSGFFLRCMSVQF